MIHVYFAIFKYDFAFCFYSLILLIHFNTKKRTIFTEIVKNSNSPEIVLNEKRNKTHLQFFYFYVGKSFDYPPDTSLDTEFQYG